MTIAVRLSALALLALTAACSRNPASPAPAPATAPAPAPAPAAAPTPVAPPTAPAAPAPATGAAADVSGDWTWSTDIGGQVIGGSMSLTKSGTTYSGEVVPDGMAAATGRTLTIAGDRITI